MAIGVEIVENNMGIERCANFRCLPGSSGPVDICVPKGIDTHCGGYSDACPIQEVFISQRDVPRETIVFPEKTENVYSFRPGDTHDIVRRTTEKWYAEKNKKA